MQNKKQSLLEAIINSVIAFFLNLIINYLILPFVGIEISISQNIELSIVFVLLSVIRNYVVRRFFTMAGNKKKSDAISDLKQQKISR